MTHRCHVEPAEWSKPEIILGAEESHHLRTVLRVRAGERIVVFDGRGGEAVAEVASTAETRIVVRVVNREVRERPRVEITLIQAIPKAQRMDLIVQKATELGMAAVLPVVTERGIVQLEGERADTRRHRWQKIATNAAEQCGAGWIPSIEPITELGAIWPRLVLDVLLIGSLEADAEPLRGALARIRETQPRRVGLLIGPEGDFTATELAAARQTGAIPVSFGPRTLRVETAAIYGMCVLAYELL